ncbi:hypothetical protein MRX96_041356 [Rhipicephalus microplus]
MGPVSEVDMTYSMDCYFRQSWMDRRLGFSRIYAVYDPVHIHAAENMATGHVVLERKALLPAHNHSTQQVCSLGPGRHCAVFVKAHCECELSYEFGKISHGYATLSSPDSEAVNFDLVRTPTDNQSDFSRKEGPFAMLLVSFQLKRHMGYFLIEVYAPCTLLVVLSWVSFWINREATADRIALGVTTILTMTFLALESRNDLPKVPYCTALDYYVAIGFGFVFATIVEFAIVHYFTKVGSGEFYYCPEMEAERLKASSEESCDEESGSDEQQPLESVTYGEAGDHCPEVTLEKDDLVTWQRHLLHRCRATRSHRGLRRISRLHAPPGRMHWWPGSANGRLEAPAEQAECPTRHFTARHGSRPSSRRSARRRDYRRQKRPSLMARRRMSSQIQELWINSVSKVDRISRVVFPLAFIVVNVVYWLTYFREDS